jgi:hypothetical protein
MAIFKQIKTLQAAHYAYKPKPSTSAFPVVLQLRPQSNLTRQSCTTCAHYLVRPAHYSLPYTKSVR